MLKLPNIKVRVHAQKTTGGKTGHQQRQHENADSVKLTSLIDRARPFQ
jgi:hypothetical protein